MLELCEAERSPSTPGSPPPPSPVSDESEAGMPSTPPPTGSENLWIAGWSGPDDNRSLQFIVSLTQGQMGRHPLFVADLEPGALDAPSIRTAMSQVAATLAGIEPPVDGRVYAVFGPRPFAQAFSQAWCLQVDATPSDDPNMAASYMECTRSSIREAPTPIPGHRIRRAGYDDVDAAANFCQKYSSYPYHLDLESARREATTLIDRRALFFYEVDTGTDGYCATCMLAVGRSSANVASITKLYTLPDFRGKGFASQLLHYVCSCLLNAEGKSAVVSLVPFENDTYKRLAMRMGFDHSPSGHEGWLELGFENVNMGHW
ncbi:hypothetical protein FRC01_000690 [Tulasnella sp. 417]|nr:hypothetical protein FRC01_000690 [Tulasnella sp. 417]